MSDSTAMSRFRDFRNEYEDRQADRPKAGPDDPEIFHIAAKEHSQGSELLLEKFFVGLTVDEKEEILEELDMTDRFNNAILQQAPGQSHECHLSPRSCSR